MDLKGSLIDTKIKIYTSQSLIKFLESLPFEDGMPEKILEHIKSVKGKHKSTKIETLTLKNNNSVGIHLSNKDLDNINRIKDILKTPNELLNDIDTENVDPNCNDDEEHDSNISKEEKNKKQLESDTESKQHHNIDKLCLNTSDIDWLYTYLNNKRKNDVNIPYLHELLEGAQIDLPENMKIKRNPDLEARCVKLRAQQEAREYRKMTRGVDNVRMRYPEDSIGFQLKQMNRQMIAIGQFIISIFAGFLFGFRGLELMIGDIDFGVRLLLGVMIALVIALAEIYFLAKKINEELSIPETVQLGGPPKFADERNTQPSEKIDSKEHID